MIRQSIQRILGLLVTPLLLSAGCGRVVQHKAEEAIVELLPRYLGRADTYTVTVSGRPDAIYRGRLRTVHIEGKNVALTPELTINRLTVDIKDVSVDRGSQTLQNVGETRFSARLTEAAINRYALGRGTALRDLSISLGGDGRTTVTARPELLGYPTIPVSLQGQVSLRGDGARLDFSPDRASVDTGILGSISVGIPGFVREHIASRVNPIADLSAAPLPIHADSVTVEYGAATITGTVPPGALQKAVAEAGR
jgi:hypothetical protein